MTQEELEQRINLDPQFFEPFVLTSVDVFAIVVDSPTRVLLEHFCRYRYESAHVFHPLAAGNALECGSSSLSGRVETLFSSLGIW